MIPTTLEEAFDELDKIISLNQRDMILIVPESEFIAMHHHGLGRWIRNNWSLWKTDEGIAFWFLSMGIGHADDMSGIILTSYHRYLRGYSIKLEEQVKLYKDYWRKSGIDPLTLDEI